MTNTLITDNQYNKYMVFINEYITNECINYPPYFFDLKRPVLKVNLASQHYLIICGVPVD